MITSIFRRHKKSCPYKSAGRGEDRYCLCPFWADGNLPGMKLPRSTGATSKNEATRIARSWENVETKTETAVPSPDAPGITLEEAITKYLETVKRDLAESTVDKYKVFFRQFITFAISRGIVQLADFTTDDLEMFRTTWKDGRNAGVNKMDRLKQFFKKATERGWIRTNPAADIKSGKRKDAQKLPFTANQVQTIFATAEKKRIETASSGKKNAQRLYALVLFLRYSGLRIGDAVNCPIDRLDSKGRLRLYTAKTGTHVYVKLHPDAVAALESIPKMSEERWFWSGNGKLRTAVTKWQDRLRHLFRDAGIADGHPHRFRHTFATDALNKGVPLQQVAAFLGNSMRIVEKHYGTWGDEQQRNADEALARTFQKEPETVETDGETEPEWVEKKSRLGTRKAHEKRVVN
jgi:site-specific recombinase XerD